MCLTRLLSIKIVRVFVSMALPVASLPAEASSTVQIQCAQGRSLSAEIQGQKAIVTFEGHRLILPRRPFEVGSYYESKGGALVIDGSFIAFVPAGDASWQDCEIQPSSNALERQYRAPSR